MMKNYSKGNFLIQVSTSRYYGSKQIDFGQFLMRYKEDEETAAKYEETTYDSDTDEWVTISQHDQYDPTIFKRFLSMWDALQNLAWF